MYTMYIHVHVYLVGVFYSAIFFTKALACGAGHNIWCQCSCSEVRRVYRYIARHSTVYDGALD